jgi:hypothetical protein
MAQTTYQCREAPYGCTFDRGVRRVELRNGVATPNRLVFRTEDGRRVPVTITTAHPFPMPEPVISVEGEQPFDVIAYYE